MATERDVIIEQRSVATGWFEGMRVSWGGIWAGVLVVIGTLLLLTTLGLAIGISTADPRNPNFGTLGTGAAIWTGLSLLIVLYLGGMAATRLSMTWDRAAGMFQGALVWVISIVAILFLAANGIGLVLGGAFGLATNVAQGAAAAVSQGGDLADLSQGDVQQMLSRLSDPQTVTRITGVTGLPREQVESTLENIRQRVQAVQNDPARAAAEVKQGLAALVPQAKERLAQGAAEAQPEASATVWLTFFALLLSLAAAVLGALTGRRSVGRAAGA